MSGLAHERLHPARCLREPDHDRAERRGDQPDDAWGAALGHDDGHRAPAAFRSDAHARLVELRRRFDPDRVLQGPPAVIPTSA
jgi:hypothetical protein